MVSKATRLKMRISHLGKKFTKEHKNNMSIAHGGKKRKICKFCNKQFKVNKNIQIFCCKGCATSFRMLDEEYKKKLVKKLALP